MSVECLSFLVCAPARLVGGRLAVRLQHPTVLNRQHLRKSPPPPQHTRSLRFSRAAAWRAALRGFEGFVSLCEDL